MVRGGATLVCVLLSALTVGKTARAEDTGRFELTWSPSRERPCVSHDVLKQDVASRLGRDPFAPAGRGELTIEGRELPARAGRRAARIVERDHEGRVLGTRDLEAASCEELRRSAAFVVFLIVDPDAALGGPAISSPPATNDEEPSAPATAPVAESPKGARRASPPRRPRARPTEIAPPRVTRSVRVDLGLMLALSNGFLPKADLGFGLALGVLPTALPVRFEWRATYRLPVESARGEDFRAIQQEWRVCYAPRVVGALFATACGGAAWTAIFPDARGLAGGDHAAKNVFSPTIALGPAVELGATRLAIDLSLARPSPRYAFHLMDDGQPVQLYEVSRTAWSVAIGASRSFL